MNIITWCNDNNGFLTAILSVVGLALSIIAIIVSIRTARLPYKKKLILGSSLSVQTQMIPGLSVQMDVAGVSASATNVGNRPISITYLGYAIKKDGKLNNLYPIDREFNCRVTLAPSEKTEQYFAKDELLKCFSRENRNIKLFVTVSDTEGKIYLKKAGTIGRLIDNLTIDI